MRKYLLIVVSIWATIPLVAQFCLESPRGMPELPLEKPSGYLGDVSMEIPGNTLIDKADSCLMQIFEQFPSELTGIEIGSGTSLKTTFFQVVRYKQSIDEILLEDHGVSFRFDLNNTLVAVNVNLALDSAQLSDLADLAEGGIPGKHKICLTLEGYELRPVFTPHTHDPPVVDGLTDITMEITYPSYTSNCRGQELLVSVTDNGTLPLSTMNSNKLKGKYANHIASSPPTFETISENYWTYDCEDVNNKHEALMAYYHLNYAYDYIQSQLVPYGLPINDVVFSHYVVGAAEVPIVEITDVGNEIKFGGLPEDPQDDYNDVAEDADHIVSAAFEGYLTFNLRPIPIGESQGVGAGTLAYWTWRYMVNKGYPHTSIGEWAGEDHIAIDVASVQTETGIEFGALRDNAGIWASTLREIYLEVFAPTNQEAVMHELLVNVVLDWDDNGIIQSEAAIRLHDIAKMMASHTISDAQLLSLYVMPVT